jgi:hypothetical protein
MVALGLVWNILSEGWAFASVRNFNPITQKLFDFTAEAHLHDATGEFIIDPKKNLKPVAGRATLPSKNPSAIGAPLPQDLSKDIVTPIEFRISKRGDKFSSYYHFFGLVLWSTAVSAETHSYVGQLIGRTGAMIEAIKHKKTSGLALERSKRIYNDLQGAIAGAKIVSSIKDNTQKTRPLSKEETLSRYFKSNDKFKGSYQIADGRPPAYFGVEADSKYWTKPMEIEELKWRFEYAIYVDRNIFAPEILASSLNWERLQRGLSNYYRLGSTDSDLNALIGLWKDGATIF